MRKLSLLFVLLSGSLQAQSIELMPGTERIFGDLQWLQSFEENRAWSLFSRTRFTVDYQEQTSFFTGAYLNYTLSSGFGASLIGRASTTGAASDIGLHFFKAHEHFMVFAISWIPLTEELSYSAFSIMRYTPSINRQWKLYSSLELFTSFDNGGHRISFQGLRLGVDRAGYQFGLGLNLSARGVDFASLDRNPGIFLRKQF